MSTLLKCNIKDCLTNNLPHRAKRLVKVVSIAKICKTNKYSNNHGAKNKFYSLKRNIQSEKRKHWLKAMSTNDPKGSKNLETKGSTCVIVIFIKVMLKNVMKIILQLN